MEFLKYAEEAAVMMLDYKREFGSYSFRKEPDTEKNLSLFSGKAGVGYFYLQCISSKFQDCLLAPKINQSASKETIKRLSQSIYSELTISKSNLYKRILEKYYIRTLTLLSMFYREQEDQYFRSISQVKELDLLKSFFDFVQLTFSPKGAYYSMLWDAYELERLSLEIDHSIKSFCLIDIEQTVAAEMKENTAGAKEVITSLKLRVDPLVRTKISKWNWSLYSDDWKSNGPENRGRYYTVLKPTLSGTSEFPITNFGYLVLKLFLKPATVHTAKSKFCKLITRNYEVNQQEIEAYFDSQLTEFICAAILLHSR